MRLMHRRRSQKNDLGAVLGDGGLGLGKKQRENILLLAGKKRLIVWRDID